MSESTPHFAPVVILLFLGTILLTAASLLALLYGLIQKSRAIWRIGAAAVTTIVSGYFFLLVGVSLASSEKVLPSGGSKYFCEMDCHLAYSVVGVRKAPYIDAELGPATKYGQLVGVRLKTWFDRSTISPRRGDGPLSPNKREVVLIDSENRRFQVSAKGQAAIARSHLPSTPLTEALRPGESYTTDLIFEVPADVHGLRLLVTEADSETRFVIGHENSLLHKKIYFDLESAPRIPPMLDPDYR
jgi:hypothetical protein